MKSRFSELSSQRDKLISQERELRKNYDKVRTSNWYHKNGNYVITTARCVVKLKQIFFFNQLTILFVSSDLSWLCIDIVHVISTIESPDGAN